MHTRTVRKCDFNFLTEWFYPVFKKTILTGQYVDACCEPVNRSILHISLHHVTRFEPITAAHFDQRYNNNICWKLTIVAKPKHVTCMLRVDILRQFSALKTRVLWERTGDFLE